MRPYLRPDGRLIVGCATKRAESRFTSIPIPQFSSVSMLHSLASDGHLPERFDRSSHEFDLSLPMSTFVNRAAQGLLIHSSQR